MKMLLNSLLRRWQRLSCLTMLVALTICGQTSHGAIIYQITSFDATDAVTASSTTAQYDPTLPSFVLAPGVTGTDGNGLFTLQTLNATAETAATSPRFKNTDNDANQTNGTLVTDASATLYFQFGASGLPGNLKLNLTNLEFHAGNATTTNAQRGYSITASVNGGPYTSIASGTLSSFRVTAGGASGGATDDVIIPLTGASFQGISTIDFRVFSVTGGVEYADFTVNGVTTPAPEPTSLGVLAAGLVPFILRRRRVGQR
jgi:hypothetical protein